jgi:uncharacterized membrane protein
MGVQGYRWTAATGAVDLGDFPGGNAFSLALDVSSDGRVIVGGGSDEIDSIGFSWTDETGLVKLGRLMYQAAAVSADGSAIAGVGFQDGQGAVRWTAAEGPVWLGHLPGLSKSVYSFPAIYRAMAP